MLPIFSLYRSGNLTESVADDLFGPLKIGLAAIKWAKIIGIIIVVLSGILCGIIYILKKRADNKVKTKYSNDEERPLPTGVSGENKKS